MLLQFSFENFKSFKEEATLSFLAGLKRDRQFHIIKSVNHRVLPVAALVGANASGKSNVIQALEKMTQIVTGSVVFGKPSKNRRNPRINPYLFDAKSAKSPSLFEVFFTDEGSSKTYQYGFKIRETILEEWLYVRSKAGKNNKVFERKAGEKLDLSGIPEKNRQSLEISLNEETLLVSLGAIQRVEILEKVYSWFDNLIFADYGSPSRNFFKSALLPSDFAESPKVQEDVIEFLSSFDPTIKKFEISKLKDTSEDYLYEIYSFHETADGGLVKIPFNDESSGTLKMFSLYQDLVDALATGSVLIVDELNSKLHPLLMRSLIALFLDEERNSLHAQLIFSSHDLWVLGCGLFRKDEIWFTEKNLLGESSLYSLTEFKTGQSNGLGGNFENDYALGRYGAIPDMKMIHLKKEEEISDEQE